MSLELITHICGDDGGELAAVLLVVSLVHDVDHTLGVGVTVVGGVWGTLIIIVNKEKYFIRRRRWRLNEFNGHSL